MQDLLHAFLWSTGNGGGDAAGVLLPFPVLSELLFPLKWWAGTAGLQTYSSLSPCQEQPSSKVKSQLLLCPLTQMEQPVKGNRGMSYSNRVSRWHRRSTVLSINTLLSAEGCHAHLLISSVLICPRFASLSCHTAELGQI